jgi:uncharacterized delta-60 repeat protein
MSKRLGAQGPSRPLFLTVSVAAALALSAGLALGFDGDLDPSFDGPTGTGNGKFTVPITPGNTGDFASAMAIQPSDGKIVVAGGTDALVGPGNDTDFVVARFNTDGTLDTGFGGDGIVTTKVAGADEDYANAVAIQADGKIVAAGTAEVDPTATDNHDFALVRYNADGSLDTNTDSDVGTHLDTDGIFTTPVGGVANGYEEAYGVAVQPLNGKIVAAGESEQSGGLSDFGLIRLNPATGTLDDGGDGAAGAGFGGDGRVTTDFAGGYDNPSAIAIQSDNKIVLAGRADIGGGVDEDFALARYIETDGTLDPAFDGDATMPGFPGNGKVTTNFVAAAVDTAFGVMVQTSDGKLVAVGTTATGDFALARYNAAAGTLDTGFDGSPTMPGFPGNGKVTTAFNNAFATDVAVQADGKIVAVGREDIDPSASSNFDFALTRYGGADGALDPSFAGDGILTDSLAATPAADLLSGVAVDSSGRIVVTGSSFLSGTGNDLAMARYGPGVAPVVSITSGPSGTTAESQPTFGFSANEAASFQCRFDSAGFGACSGTGAHASSTPLADGPHTLEVQATDAVGNVGSASRAFTVVAAECAALRAKLKKLNKKIKKADDPDQKAKLKKKRKKVRKQLAALGC